MGLQSAVNRSRLFPSALQRRRTRNFYGEKFSATSTGFEPAIHGSLHETIGTNPPLIQLRHEASVVLLYYFSSTTVDQRVDEISALSEMLNFKTKAVFRFCRSILRSILHSILRSTVECRCFCCFRGFRLRDPD